MRRFYKRKGMVFFSLLLILLLGAAAVPRYFAAAEQKPGTPVIKTIESLDYNHVKLTWSEVKGADGYRIFRKTADTSWKRVGSYQARSYTEEVESGVTYYYAVCAYIWTDDGKTLIPGDFSQERKIKAVTAAPSASVKAAGWNSAVVSWKGVAGADGYRVHRKTDSGRKTLANCSASARSFKIEGLEPGISYTFTVRAYANTSQGKVWGKFDADGVKIKLTLGTVKLKAAENTDSGIRVSWSKTAGAQGYRVYRKGTSADASWERIAVVKGQSKVSYTDKKASVGKKYYYTVRAYRVVDSKTVLGGYQKKGVSCTRSKNMGWFTDSEGRRYYLTEDGRYTGVHKIGSKVYTFDQKGFLKRTIDPAKPMVALTYDDGPSASTPEILDILDKCDAAATFFVVGNRVDGSSAYRSYVKRAYQMSCQIGNHTYEHKTLTALSESGIRSQMKKCDTAVKEACGALPSVMRPPGGSRNAAVDAAVLKPLIHWSVDTLDWKTRSASQTVSSVLNNVKDGSIVLMHDLYASTADASAKIIPALIKKGYQLVTVEEMAAGRGGMKAGKRYYSFYR
ncbi:MAG: polysaccharide deacetylase family protein [Lachnospiraceae bacterium]|nr:polysaccharide deacetylase family protein [Lachnospiraceae bacterium]